jgi:hypothetical protein
MTEPGAGARRARRWLQAIVVLVLWGLMTHGTFAGSGDEPHYLVIAHSIAFDGDLDLANNYGANEPLIAGGHLQPESHVRPGVGGVARPVHDVGLPLLAAPVVRVAVPLTRVIANRLSPAAMQRARLTPGLLYRHLLSLVAIALTAFLAGLMFDTFLALGGSTRAAFGTALLLTLSPPLLIFSILFFTELLSAVVCFVVFRRLTMERVIGPWAWAITGGLIGLLFLVHARNIGLIVPLAAVGFQRLRDPSATRQEWIGFAGGLAALLFLRTIVNYEFWGTLMTTPHARLGGWPGFAHFFATIGTRAAGMVIDQEYGLLVYAPIYLLTITGTFALARERTGLARIIIAIVGFYVLLILLPLTNVHGWTGGWSPPARFLTPVVPLLGVAVFAGVRTGTSAAIVVLVATQIVIDACVWQKPKLLWNDGDGRAAFCDELGANVCRALPSLAPRD